VTGSRVIPGRQLKRPRIDVLVNPSGLYRDLFPHMIRYIDAAIRQAAAQQDVENLIARHSGEIRDHLVSTGVSPEKAARMAAVRIFSEAPGSYGTGLAEMAGASSFWVSDQELVNVYENRVGFAFGQDTWGESATALFKANLKSVDVACHSRSSSLYGLLDNDDVFQYLGGLSLAVTKESGRTPDTLIVDQRTPRRIRVEDVARTIGREIRTRYLNPKWIEGMQKEKYAGARQMSNFVEYLWGWQITTPSAIDRTKWEQAYAVYVEDKYGLELKAFFDDTNPWAYQSLTARMLEASRKNYWPADEKTEQKLATEYALNAVSRGLACCDHTCNNPLLNQMVVNIISLPGVMAPHVVEQFKLAVEKAAGNQLEQQVAKREALNRKLTAGFKKMPPPLNQTETEEADAAAKKRTSGSGDSKQVVEGYRMEEIESDDQCTDLTTSGVQWLASLVIILVIGLFITGTHRRFRT